MLYDQEGGEEIHHIIPDSMGLDPLEQVVWPEFSVMKAKL